MRFKNRYLLVELMAKAPLELALEDQNEFVGLLRDEVADACGILGYAKVFSSFKVIYYNAKANYALLRVSRDYFRLLKQSMFFVRRVREADARVRVVFVAGTIRSAEKRLVAFLKEAEHRGLKQLFSLQEVKLE